MTFIDVVAIIGTVGSVVGIPLAIFLARRGRQVPKLRHLIDFDVLVSSDDDYLSNGVVVTAAGQEITGISRSRIAIWNHSGDTINGQEMLVTDPLRIQLSENDVIIQARLLRTSRYQIAAELELDPKSPSVVLLDFDFLDARDGMIVEVIHQGTSMPKVLGTIRGVPPSKGETGDLTPEALDVIGKSNWLRRAWMRRRSNDLLPYIALSLIVICCLPTFLAMLIDDLGYENDYSRLALGTADAVLGILPNAVTIIITAISMAIAYGLFTRKFYQRSRVIIPANVIAIDLTKPSKGQPVGHTGQVPDQYNQNRHARNTAPERDGESGETDRPTLDA